MKKINFYTQEYAEELDSKLKENKIVSIEGDVDINKLHNLTYNYLVEYLMKEDKVCNERLNFILVLDRNLLRRLLPAKNQMKIKYKLDTDVKITNAVKNAITIQKSIVFDLRKRINELNDIEKLKSIVNNPEETKEFLQKYFTKEEDITDDIIFQCDKYVY